MRKLEMEIQSCRLNESVPPYIALIFLIDYEKSLQNKIYQWMEAQAYLNCS